MQKIATFGSLKEGAYNHSRFGLGAPVAKSSIRGAMYQCFTYPHLYREEVSEADKVRDHEVEIFEVDDETYAMICSMELGSGYQIVKQELEGHDVTIFYSEDDLDYKENWLEAYNAETVPGAFSSVIS